jgi:low temperature requirement protein LtrA
VARLTLTAPLREGARRLVDPPRLRTVEADQGERRATWTELFFDLVFVVAVAQVANILSADPTLLGLLRFAALFIPIWWAWMGYTFYANRFDTDDIVHRLLYLAGMLAVAALAVTVHDAFGGGSARFALAYFAVRLVLVGLYLRARLNVPRARNLTDLFLASFGSAAALWLVSVFVPEPGRYAFWGVALALELATPLLAWRLIAEAPIHRTHLPERFGLFTLIVLGESVLAVVLGTAGVSWHWESTLVAIAGFVIAACIWWVYFDFFDAGAVLGRGIMRGLVYTYGHFPLVAGIAVTGVGTKLAIQDAAGNAHAGGTGWVICVGVAVCMLALGAIHWVGEGGRTDADLWLRLAAAGGAGVLAALESTLRPAVMVWLLAALLLVVVAAELLAHEDHHQPASGGPL